MPKEVVSSKLKKGEISVCFRKKLLVLRWKDMISVKKYPLKKRFTKIKSPVKGRVSLFPTPSTQISVVVNNETTQVARS